jgi:hypothetical protein
MWGIFRTNQITDTHVTSVDKNVFSFVKHRWVSEHKAMIGLSEVKNPTLSRQSAHS